MTAAQSRTAPYSAFLDTLSAPLREKIQAEVSLRPFSTLRVGGPADLYLAARDAATLADAAMAAQQTGTPYFLLGGGSNICVSERGVRGLVLHNLCNHFEVAEETYSDAGVNFMTLFLKTAQASLSGLEFAVGIPGSVGGALVSNAGAYRQNICDLVTAIDVVEGGRRQRVGAEWMEFSYRDSRLRHPGGPPATLVGVWLRMARKPRVQIMARARDNQRQRISKQPWLPSAGSFFKNVYDRALAETLPTLPTAMKEAGVVPAGYLSDACGCRGLTVGGAQISRRHGNFVVNRGPATATDIYRLTRIVKQRVYERFGVVLEEEVLLVGDWDPDLADSRRPVSP